MLEMIEHAMNEMVKGAIMWIIAIILVVIGICWFVFSEPSPAVSCPEIVTSIEHHNA